MPSSHLILCCPLLCNLLFIFIFFTVIACIHCVRYEHITLIFYSFTERLFPGFSHYKQCIWSCLLEVPWYDLNQIPYDYTVEVRNRFKGLDLIDGIPGELWNEVCDFVQETETKTIPMEKKCKKGNWLSGEALQIAVKRKVKSKGEKERYKHLNAEFQRIARRDKKAFFSDQCKEIEEKNRMGKTRDLFKKIRDTKGTFHAKIGLIKDRNGIDLTEAEDIKKRWQEYTEELYKKKSFMTRIITMV